MKPDESSCLILHEVILTKSMLPESNTIQEFHIDMPVDFAYDKVAFHSDILYLIGDDKAFVLERSGTIVKGIIASEVDNDMEIIKI